MRAYDCKYTLLAMSEGHPYSEYLTALVTGNIARMRRRFRLKFSIVRWWNIYDNAMSIELRRVTKIWERLYLGNLEDAQRLARSNPQRISTVIALCREPTAKKAAKITYIRIPISDLSPISAQQFEDIMFAIAIAVRRGNVLIHCFAGMSRSPILMAAWLNRCGYAAIDKALDEIAKLRNIAPSEVLLRSVIELSGK